MVGANQNLNGSRDLATPLSGTVCNSWDSTSYLPNLKSLPLPTAKIRKAIQNSENGVIWGSWGSLKVTEDSATISKALFPVTLSDP